MIFLSLTSVMQRYRYRESPDLSQTSFPYCFYGYESASVQKVPRDLQEFSSEGRARRVFIVFVTINYYYYLLLLIIIVVRCTHI